MSFGNALAGLGFAIKAYDAQLDAQQQRQKNQLEMARLQLENKHIQQQAQLDAFSAYADYQKDLQKDQQPDPSQSPYYATPVGSTPGGGGPALGGLPGAMPAPGGAAPGMAPGGAPGGAGGPGNPLLGSIPAQGGGPLGAAMRAPGPPAGGGGAPGGGMPAGGPGGQPQASGPPEPPDSHVVAQQLYQNFLRAPGATPQLAMQAMRQYLPRVMDQKIAEWKNKLEVYKTVQEEADRQRRMSDTESHTAVEEGNSAARLGIDRAGLSLAEKREAREEAKAADAKGGIISDDAAEMLAEEWISTGKAPVGFSRKPENITKITNAFATAAKNAGMNGHDIAAKLADFSGVVAEEKNIGNRQGNLETLGNEVSDIGPKVIADSNAVSRTDWPDINKLIEAAQTKTGGTAVVKLGSDLNSLVDIYARYINNGPSTDSSRKQAIQILNQDWSKGQIETSVRSIMDNIEIGKRAANKVRADLLARVSGKQPTPSAAANGATDFSHLWQ